MKHLADGAGPWQQGRGYTKKLLLEEGELGAPGTLVQLVRIPPHTTVADHYHAHCTEVFHVTGGRGAFVIDGRRVELAPGDTLLCQPGEVHSTINEADEPFCYVVFKTNVRAGDLHWV